MMNGIRKAAYRVYQFALMRGEALLPWRMPDVISGTGATASLASRVKADGVASVLVVTGPHIFASGLTGGLISALEDAGIHTSVYSSVMADPTVSCVEEIRSAYIECGAQGIVAFGGGSPMDAAKAAAARIARPDRPVANMRGLLKVGRALPPFYAVPTTAGTGSETTIAAVITDDATHRKYAITDLALLPRAAVLDPALTLGLPPRVTAATGMDALTHAVESFTNLYNTRETRELAQKAVRLIFKNLPRAYEDGSDIEARENMLMASFYAGAAFTRAGVGNVHAIAHTLGGLQDPARLS